MKHNIIKKLFQEWQDYINDYFNDFIYFNEFLKYKNYQYDVLAIGKKLVIYKVNIDNLSYIITDYGINIEIRYYDDKLNKYVNIYNYLI